MARKKILKKEEGVLSPTELKFVSDELKNDPGFVLAALGKNSHMLMKN